MKELKVGDKLYGAYGECEIIMVDNKSEIKPYKIKDERAYTYWITPDLKWSTEDMFPSLFLKEDCPECYKIHVKKYKVLYRDDYSSLSISEMWYKDKENFDSENNGFGYKFVQILETQMILE